MEDKIQHSKPVPPFVRFCAANIPMVFDDSLSYYECLCALWKWLQTDVIDVINNNATVTQKWREELTEFEGNVTDEIEEFESDMRSDFSDLSDAFDTLKTWVETYFDNLDVQEEINNKLDAMAEDGTLADIIADYIKLKGVLAYENVNALKNAENIVNGSFCETYGYYTKGDGGSAKYIIREITNDDTVDGMFIISITSDPTNTLIAELIPDSTINAKQLGIKGDGETDETSKISSAINKGYPLYFPKGTYLIASTITAPNNVCIIGDGEATVFNSTDDTLYPIFDFSTANHIVLKGFSTSNSSFKVYPTATDTKTSRELMGDKTVYIENVLCNTVNEDIAHKTNWAGTFICNPKPNHFSPRDFEDGKYSRYGIQIYNNSGYNGIDIDNRIQDDNGDYLQVQDNSAIGIVDGVFGSAPALFMDMHAERSAIGIKNRTSTSSASSTTRPDTVYEVGYNGHLAIGCSVYDETGASGVGTIKLKDSSPSIRFYDTNNPLNINVLRSQDSKFQTVANGLVRSEYLTNGYHEYSYPLRFKNLPNSHGSLIFATTYGGGKDAHIFCSDSNGFLKFNYSNPDQAFASDIGYIMQPCMSGSTASRPTSRLTNDYQAIGFRYFDTTLGKPVFWNGTGWVDATGTTV